MYLRLLLLILSASALRLKMGARDTVFDGEYLWNNSTERYERVSIDTATGFQEYIERTSEGKWRLGSLTNHIEGTVHATIATAENLEDAWDMNERPRPNDQWVATLDGDKGEILYKLNRYIGRNEDIRDVRNLYRHTQNEAKWAVHLSIVTAFMKMNHGVLAPCVNDMLCFHPNSEIFGEFQSLLAFSFSDSSSVARRVRDTLLDVGILKNLEADILGVSATSREQDYIAEGEFYSGYTGTDVYVFVVDSGIRSSHHQFGNRVLLEYSRNYMDNNGDISDIANHGTHVASLIGGVDVGIASDVNIVCSKVIQQDGLVYGHILLKAIDDILSVQIPAIRSKDADAGIIVSMSLSFDVRWMPLEDAIAKLFEHRAITVVAAGNSAKNVCTDGVSPQAARYAVSVANIANLQPATLSSTSNYGRCDLQTHKNHDSWCKWTLPWEYSNYQDAADKCYAYGASNKPCVGIYNPLCLQETLQTEFHLCQSEPIESSVGSCIHKIPLNEGINIYAPGENIVGASSASDSAFVKLSGTSMAAPYVSGVVALLMEEAENATDVEYILYTRLLKDSCRENGNVIRSDGSEEGNVCILSLRALSGGRSTQPSLPPRPIVPLKPPLHRSNGEDPELVLVLGFFLLFCVLVFLCLKKTPTQPNSIPTQPNSILGKELHKYYKAVPGVKNQNASSSS
jgi:subtilisin family serine protease